ncbi:hypothetical protein [Streptomyces sp. A30]|uniref:hypothetical protein n=1 Tax=Streptomyces sp. A30 TaxID=2789273 RepID=UPI0039816BBE
MRERLARFCELLLLAIVRALLPAKGRHRADGHAPAPRQRPLAACPFESDGPLVRKLQRQRRRALWLAVHGIDVGPRHIHGVEVSA